MAMVTDYDCWREGHYDVTVDQVVAVLHQNADNAAKVVRSAIAAMPTEKSCACGDALKYAILTDRKAIPDETRRKLAILLDKYLQ
jgi:5'-methylthioadenosine phosphorylase